MKAERMTIIAAAYYAIDMSIKEAWPRCHYWNAVWWRINAKLSKSPNQALEYSRNLLKLYRDIQSRPEYYKSPKRPDGMSDWEWSKF